MKKRVLFLCTGNSCRSQMAEGKINHLRSDQREALQAGTQPVGYVLRLAVSPIADV